ncbi:MAG: TOMM precursor leader peptide-binding protein, partial [Thermoanaerobaculia bacterium]
MKKIRLSPSASITTTQSGVVLRSDLGTFQLHGDDVRLFVSAIVPLLDGSRDADAVAAALSDYSAESVSNFLALLQQKGLVEAVQDSGFRMAEDRFFQKWEKGEGAALGQLAAARVAIVGLEPWGAVAAIELAAAGILRLHLIDDRTVTDDDILGVRTLTASDRGRLRRDAVRDAIARVAADVQVTTSPFAIGPDDRFTIDEPFDLVVTGLNADDVYLLRRIAAFTHEKGIRSLHGHVDGFESWIGPAVVPGETACWNCFRLRRLGASDYVQPAHEIDASLSATPGQSRARSYLAPMSGLAGQSIAMEAIKLLTKYTDTIIAGRFLVQNLVSGDNAWHKVLRMPWCDVCGGAAGAKESGGERRNLASAENAEDLKKVLEGIVDRHVGIIKMLASDATPPPNDFPLTATAVVSTYT